MKPVKVWVDDCRSPAAGWVWLQEYDSAILLLRAGAVKEISVDHDLGWRSLSGYEIVKWIEKECATKGFDPPIIRVHSQSVVGKKQIEACIKQISL